MYMLWAESLYEYSLSSLQTHMTHVYDKNNINIGNINKYADMEAPIKTTNDRFHTATRQINYTYHNW